MEVAIALAILTAIVATHTVSMFLIIRLDTLQRRVERRVLESERFNSVA